MKKLREGGIMQRDRKREKRDRRKRRAGEDKFVIYTTSIFIKMIMLYLKILIKKIIHL